MNNPSIILDNGTGYMKAGFSGQDAPVANFPSMIGRPKSKTMMVGGSNKEYYLGKDADEKRGVLTLTYPIEDGIIKQWDDMEKIWNHTFTNELRVKPEEYNVLLTEAPLNPKENREKMTDMMFGTFNVKGLYIAIQAVLSLYANGKFTGCVVDSGDGVTHVVPIYDGYNLPHSVSRMDIAGRKLTDYFRDLIREEGYNYNKTSEFEIIKKMKESLCYVPLDFAEEESKINKGEIKAKEYTMPDGSVVTLRNSHIKCTELLFNPSLKGEESQGMHKLTHESINKSDIDIRKDLYKTIILSGGTTLFPGLPERLAKEVKALANPSMAQILKIELTKERLYSVWIGGSILSSISTFDEMWISREEYEDTGASIVHRKCF